jgi:hypothetical protein
MAFEIILARLNSLERMRKAPQALEIVALESDRRCPKDTHQLVNSRYIRVRRNEWVIGYEAPYAVYVHEILWYNHPNGEAKFLENAWMAKRLEFLDKLLEE